MLSIHRVRALALALGLVVGGAVTALSTAVAEESATAAARPPTAAASIDALLDRMHVSGRARLDVAVPVALRDGTVLSAIVIVPDGASATSRRPAILVQTPYTPSFELGIGVDAAVLGELVSQGYVVVVVNVRGTQWSEGEYHWLHRARDDGLDALKWITSQPWSNGSIGTIGCSSSGEVTVPLAMANPPALKAVVAMASATGVGVIPGFADRGIFYMGGVPSFDWAWWYHAFGYVHHPKFPAGISQSERVALTRAFDSNPQYNGEDLSWAGHLPSGELLDAIGSPQSEFSKLITMKPNDAAWQAYDFLNEGQSTTIPMLHIDSWYDTIEVYGTSRMFQYLSGNSPNQYLMVGGTGHCGQGTETANTMVGKRPIGDARFDFAGNIVKWFNHWLKDGGAGDLGMPKVQYYPLESNKWVMTDRWPVAATPRRLYLSSSGHANSLSGDGQLLPGAPRADLPDQFTDDPMHPVPTRGGGCCTDEVSLDQTEIEQRQDVLVYTTPPLEKAIDIAGYISATLYLSSSARDGDIMLKLVDVYPDGRAFNVTDTAQRLRYRDGIFKEAPMVPGQTYRVSIGQMVIASRIAAGHRIRLEVSGTNFPEYERNQHTGGRNFDESELLVAQVTLHHGPKQPAYLELPISR